MTSFTDRRVGALTSSGVVHVIERTHEDGPRVYILDDGTELPSVTTIIKRVFGNPYGNIAADVLEHARARGSEVHNSIAMLSGKSRGSGRRTLELDWTTVHHEVLPRLKCFDFWRTKTHWRPDYVETAVVSLKYGFAGTADQIGAFPEDDDGLFTIADFKPPTAFLVSLQLSAYAIAVKECLNLPLLPRRMPVYLSDDKPARYPILRHGARDRDRFLNVLNTYNIGKEEKVW